MANLILKCFSNTLTAPKKSRWTLSTEDKPYKLFIVDVALGIFLSSEQLFHFFVSQLFTEVSHQMTEFSRGNVAIAVLVEVTETLDEVIGGIDRALARDGLQDWQEDFEANPLLRSVLVRNLLHFRLCRILAKGSEHLSDLGHLDLAVALLVEDGEGLLEIYDLVLCEGCHI